MAHELAANQMPQGEAGQPLVGQNQMPQGEAGQPLAGQNQHLIGEEGVIQCLTLCGLTQENQRRGWIDEGMSSMIDICTFRPSEVYDVGGNLQKLAVNRGGSRQGRGQLKKIEALVRWCLERRSSGLILDANAFTQDVMMDMVEKIRLEKDAKDVAEAEVPDVGQFKPAKWVSWKLGFKTTLSQINSLMDNLPLTYVIRPETIPDAEALAAMSNVLEALAAMSDTDRRCWTVQLRGGRFQKDNHKVFRKLKVALLDTDGWTWIQSFDPTENGRAAWQALVAHYDGPGEREKRVAIAKRTLKTLHYRSEKHAINFEIYSTRMLDALTILAENGVRYEPSEWVDYLLDGIDEHAHHLVHTAKSIIRFDDALKQDFTLASNKLSEFITKETNDGTGPHPRGGRRLSSYHGRGNGGGRGRGGRGRGRGGRGRGGRGNPRPPADFPNADPNDTRTHVAGIDVSDPCKDFTTIEWSKLREAGYVDTLKYRRKQYQRRTGYSSSASVASVASLRSENNDLRSRIAALEGAMRAEDTNRDNNSTIATTSRTTASNGTQFGAGAYSPNKKRKANPPNNGGN